MRVVIAGATGLIGRAVCRRLLADRDTVVALSRDPDRARGQLPPGVEVARADYEPAALAPILAEADAVVNLAGRPVLEGRWNEAVKEAIRTSRVETTRAIVEGLRAATPRRPRRLVNASATGYYGPGPAEPALTEGAPPGEDFLARTTVEWEAAATAAEADGVRVVRLRFGVVLARDGGALPRMARPFRWFVGGRVGPPDAGFPWIHVDDAVGLLVFALRTEAAAGPMNAVAPEPTTNRELAKAIGRVLRRPAWFPVPNFVLRIVLGEAAKVATAGRLVRPQRALELGYRFAFPELKPALRDLLRPEISE